MLLVTPVEWALPRSGTASLVVGMVSFTMFENTVKDSKMVTPEIIIRCREWSKKVKINLCVGLKKKEKKERERLTDRKSAKGSNGAERLKKNISQL